jgi:ADP-heptose:LPS heptosyltransferase
MGKHFLENVHAYAPEARLGIVVSGRVSMIRDLLAAYPWIEVLEANRRALKPLIQLMRRFHATDVAVTQYSSRGTFNFPTKVVARALTKRRGLIGFEDGHFLNSVLYDHLLPFDTKKALKLHEEKALTAARVPVSVRAMTFSFLKHGAVLHRFNLEPGAYLLVHPLGGTDGRGLHLETWRSILENLVASVGKELVVVVTGGKGDAVRIARIAAGLPIRSIAGETTLQELAHLVSEARMMVSVDTGVAHLTAQLQKPLIVLRSCIGYNWWHTDQYQGNIVVLEHDEVCAGGHLAKDFPACIGSISPEEVDAAVKKMFRSLPRHLGD